MTEWRGEEMDRPYHPAALIFPLLEGQEFEDLKADIQANGLLEAIWLHPDGSILDGRNRHRACLDLGLEPKFRVWTDNGAPFSFVLSMNLHRRHLTSSQRAVLSVEVLPMLEEEARERQRKHGDTAPGRGKVRECPDCHVENPNWPPADEPPDDRDYVQCPNCGYVTLGEIVRQVKATQQTAALFQTNDRYVQVAKNLNEQAPDLLEEVRTGGKTIPQAARELVRRTKVAPPPLTGKYRILYADPPWKYNDSGIINDDNYGRAERHYPAMTIEELCMLGEQIKGISEPNAILFMWTTSPMLEDAFKVICAWGFQYKTSFVWDKVRHNYGHYNSVRHEFLLICTHGSCLPDQTILHDSVQTIERSDVHSEKPEQFRRIIEELYTQGTKLELFARSSADGWDRWGNEPR